MVILEIIERDAIAFFSGAQYDIPSHLDKHGLSCLISLRCDKLMMTRVHLSFLTLLVQNAAVHV
jgi:hypothetical protein